MSCSENERWLRQILTNFGIDKSGSRLFWQFTGVATSQETVTGKRSALVFSQAVGDLLHSPRTPIWINLISMQYVKLTLSVLLILSVEIAQAQPRESSTVNFVTAGRIELARVAEGKWERGAGYIVSTGMHYLYAGRGLGRGDFAITATVSLEKLEKTAAAFVLDGNQFGFEGSHGRMFVQGSQFGDSRAIANPQDFITAGKPFKLEVKRRGSELTFKIDDRKIWTTQYEPEHIGTIGLRPWRSTMRIYDFAATGNLIEAADPPKRTQLRKLSIPTIDISGETHRQVIVAAGTESEYRGQVNTVLMADGKTMFATWSIGHGGQCGPLMKSVDGGLTWTDLLPTPNNWGEISSCPCIFRMSDSKGVERLFVFAGRGKHHSSMSKDGGNTWTPMKETGLFKPGGNTAIIPIDNGRRYLLLMQRGPTDAPRDEMPNAIWQAVSSDGGQTWKDYRKVCEVQGAVPCEPDLIRSPDGKQIACLMRENSRRFQSLVMFSDGEGTTWSKARELPASLTGDRHVSCYTDDGRLVVVFRDRAVGSPTYGHFVAWMGTYDDIRHGRPGQYRIKLLHSHAGADCGYSGLERLPDGTIVATTYIKYRPGPEKHSIVSVRFKPAEIDAAFESQIAGLTDENRRQLIAGQRAGLFELAPVHLPRNPPGDCNHYGWPVATMSGDTIVVMHRRIPGHRAKGAGRPHPQMSYGVVLRSDDGGQTWSKPYDLRDCMKPEDRNRGGIVPLSHRAKFDNSNKSPLGYKVHLHAIGTARDNAVIAVNNHGVFRSEDAGRTWKHFSTALREDTFKNPIINIGPRILDDPRCGLLVFGNWFGEVDQYHKYSEKLVTLSSLDGGATWQVEEHSVGFKQYEPAAIFHGGKYRIVTRDQNEVRSHRLLAWLPGQEPTVKKTNLQDPRLVDTVDLSFNPVTRRLEIVRSERHHMELWLWSIAPDEWSKGRWRRECRLFGRDGKFYADADGFHPGGAVIDEARGVQHIFIYTGHPNGPAGVFRLTRTLDTPKLVKFLKLSNQPTE